MPRNSAFTHAAMAAALEDTPVSYDDLAAIELEFDDVETEISLFPYLMAPISRPIPLLLPLNTTHPRSRNRELTD